MTSLALLIANYRAGLADFNANGPSDQVGAAASAACDAYAAISFEPPLEALRSFDGAATSHQEAMLALDLAEEELRNGDHETAEVLIRAAKLYLREVTPCN